MHERGGKGIALAREGARAGRAKLLLSRFLFRGGHCSWFLVHCSWFLVVVGAGARKNLSDGRVMPNANGGEVEGGTLICAHQER